MLLTQSNRKFWSGAPTALQSTMTYDSINGELHLRFSANAPSNLEIAVLKTYPFDSAVQRMTVITKKKGSPVFNVYVKGAPEKVASLCRPETSKPLLVSEEFQTFEASHSRNFCSSSGRLCHQPAALHQAGSEGDRSCLQKPQRQHKVQRRRRHAQAGTRAEVRVSWAHHYAGEQ